MLAEIGKDPNDIPFGLRTERAPDMGQDRVQDTARAQLAARMDRARVPIPAGR